MKLKTAGIMAIAAILSLGCLTAAQATPTTFAQFQEEDNSVNGFSFTNAGAGSTFSVVGGSIPVKFSYGVTNGYNGNSTDVIAAHLSFTAQVASTATSGVIDIQSMKLISMVFTADVPVNGHNNLLTLDTSTGTVFGLDGGQTANFTGDTTKGDIVNFSSDFLAFDPTANRDFSLSFSSVIPNFTVNANGYLNDFTSSGTGTFASSPPPITIGGGPVPDGAGIALMSGGLLPLVGFALYRRRSVRK